MDVMQTPDNEPPLDEISAELAGSYWPSELQRKVRPEMSRRTSRLFGDRVRCYLEPARACEVDGGVEISWLGFTVTVQDGTAEEMCDEFFTIMSELLTKGIGNEH